VAARGAVAVFAKQNAKQRERLAEKQRQYNKARKSAAATRMRKVCARGSSVPSRAS
jgi:ribosomal protein S20